MKRQTTFVLLGIAVIVAQAKLSRAFLAQAMSGANGWAIPATQVTSGGGTSTGGANNLVYSIGATGVTPMAGGGFTITPGVINAAKGPAADLGGAHAYPTPFKPSLGHDKITFTDLTAKCQIDVYTLMGRRVKHFEKNDDTDRLVWFPVANEDGGPLASGVYYFIIHHSNNIDGPGLKKGKLMIIK